MVNQFRKICRPMGRFRHIFYANPLAFLPRAMPIADIRFGEPAITKNPIGNGVHGYKYSAEEEKSFI